LFIEMGQTIMLLYFNTGFAASARATEAEDKRKHFKEHAGTKKEPEAWQR